MSHPAGGAPALPRGAVALLACPVCRQGLSDVGVGLRCPAGHAFDRARQGHVTLLAGARPPSGDSAQMVADRAAVLDAGHFAGLSRVLAAVVADGRPPGRVLDLGGGTGHHLAAVLDRLPAAVGVVLDFSRYAARRAARAHPRAMAVVADTWRPLPVRDGAVDRVLVVFAPRNGPEIARVLAPGGRLVVATPARDHLAELVGPLRLLRVDPGKRERLAAALEPHLVPVALRTHRETLVLDRAAARGVVGMGPHARHLSPEVVAQRLELLPDPVPVTVAVELRSYVVSARAGRERREGPGQVAGPLPSEAGEISG